MVEPRHVNPELAGSSPALVNVSLFIQIYLQTVPSQFPLWFNYMYIIMYVKFTCTTIEKGIYDHLPPTPPLNPVMTRRFMLSGYLRTFIILFICCCLKQQMQGH